MDAAGLMPEKKNGMTLSREGMGSFHLCRCISSGGFFILTCHAPSEDGWDFSALYRVSDNNGIPILSQVMIFGISYNVKDLSISARIETDGYVHVYASKPTYWTFFSVTPLSTHIEANIYIAE